MGCCCPTNDNDEPIAAAVEKQSLLNDKDNDQPIAANDSKKHKHQNMIERSLFEDESNVNRDECDGDKHYTQCISMKRLFAALNRYSKVNIIENQKNREAFQKFINETYYQLIDDYIHLNNQHSHELEAINDDITNNKSMFVSCDISKCIFSSRHHRHTPETNENKSHPTLKFYKNTMDSLHFYLFHCFDVGLRTKGDDNEKQQQTEEQKHGKYFDGEFSRITRMISERKHITQSFDRFSLQKNDKFNINVNNEQNAGSNNSKTFLDVLYQHLQSNNVSNIVIKTLNTFLNEQEYDTECIEDDTNVTDESNIAKCLENLQLVQAINNFFITTKVSWSLLSSSFRVGLRFYYWDYYKTLKELADESDYNLNDHSGCEICSLYITPMYSSFKQEISEYPYFSRKQYEEEVIVKVDKYIKAKIVKKTTVTGGPYEKYGIVDQNAPLSYSHLLSLVFYCDYSELSSAFSSSFRKVSWFETIDGIKKRNQNFYYLSKYLRETVECYGHSSQPSEDVLLLGPFYCGMNSLMNIPAFNIRLCAPTSTTMQIEVAIKFSTEQGIIIQFNNPQGTGHRSQYQSLRGFNVSWISRYKYEDERLFVGGYHYIKIESIRVRQTNNNYEKIIHVLCYLDQIVTGGHAYGEVVSVEDILVLKHLFNNVINNTEIITQKQKLDSYIYDTFTSFVHNKTQISLNLYHLDEFANKEVLDLIIPLNKDINQRANSDVSNLLRSEIFQIFKNVNILIIHEAGRYAMSMIGLLSLMEFGSLNKVIVQASCWGRRENNWIYSLWCTDSKTLQMQYIRKNYIISIETVAEHGHWEYWFLINKKYERL